jgi:hypothetical protein
MHYSIFVKIFVLFLLIVSACKSRKNINFSQVVKPFEIQSSDAISCNPDSFYSKIKDSDLKTKTFSAKVSAETEINNQGNSFTANLRIKKDSAMWMSISPALGIEVARVFITRDSLKFTNRINGTYFKGDYRYLNSLLQIELNFSMIQSILLGNIYLHYAKEKYNCDKDNLSLILSSLKKRQIKREEDINIPQVLTQELFYSVEQQKITSMNLQDYRPQRRFAVNYDSFLEIENEKVPTSIIVKANAEKAVEIKLIYSKINLNKEVNLPFSIPESYEPIR